MLRAAGMARLKYLTNGTCALPVTAYSSPIGSADGETKMIKFTKEDVVAAAAAQGVGILEAIRMMQTVCAKAGDESTLSRLCEIKNEMLFGND